MPLGASFSELTGADMVGLLTVNISASGDTYVNAVPEPQSAALLLAGLAGIGTLAQQRRVPRG